MAARYRLSLHVWLASPCCFVLGLLGLYHGAGLRGLCVFLFGLGGLIGIARRNAPTVGFLDKLALACLGFSALLLVAIFIGDLSAGTP
jgi:hypothetical protein